MKEKLAINFLFLELTVFKIFKIHFAKNRLNRNITSAVDSLAPPATVFLQTFNFVQESIYKHK